jgi:ribonuclease HI
MELAGVIEGLSALKRNCRVELVTDSQYVAKGIREWMPNWKRQGWQRKERGQLKPVMNADLWKRIDKLLAKHQVRVTHVLGHRGHPENEACDQMAVEAYKTLRDKKRN